MGLMSLIHLSLPLNLVKAIVLVMEPLLALGFLNQFMLVFVLKALFIVRMNSSFVFVKMGLIVLMYRDLVLLRNLCLMVRWCIMKVCMIVRIILIISFILGLHLPKAMRIV